MCCQVLLLLQHPPKFWPTFKFQSLLLPCILFFLVVRVTSCIFSKFSSPFWKKTQVSSFGIRSVTHCKSNFWSISRRKFDVDGSYLSHRHVLDPFPKFHALSQKCCHKVYLKCHIWRSMIFFHHNKGTMYNSNLGFISSSQIPHLAKF